MLKVHREGRGPLRGGPLILPHLLTRPEVPARDSSKEFSPMPLIRWPAHASAARDSELLVEVCSHGTNDPGLPRLVIPADLLATGAGAAPNDPLQEGPCVQVPDKKLPPEKVLVALHVSTRPVPLRLRDSQTPLPVNHRHCPHLLPIDGHRLGAAL